MKMNGLSVFYEHILEACGQSGKTEKSVLKEALSYGYDGLDCDLWRLEDRSKKEFFADCGFHVSSVYNGFDFGHDDEKLSKEKIKSSLELADYYGAKKFLAIAGFVWENDDRQAVINKMCGMLSYMVSEAKKYGITVMLEDFDDSAAPYSTVSGLEYFMKNVDGLRFTFDTGNFAYSLESASEAYERLNGYISYIHVKDRSYDISRRNADDSNGKADLSGRIMYPCESGGGYIGIEDIIKKAVNDGYDGYLAVEHFGAADQLLYMKRSAENLRSYLK